MRVLPSIEEHAEDNLAASCGGRCNLAIAGIHQEPLMAGRTSSWTSLTKSLFGEARDLG